MVIDGFSFLGQRNRVMPYLFFNRIPVSGMRGARFYKICEMYASITIFVLFP